MLWPAGYLLMKRDLYERPNHKGYTGIKDEAGRYSLQEALEHAEWNGWANVIHENDAPEFTKACYDDLRKAHLARKLMENKLELWQLCAAFITTHEITAPETIYQNENVIMEASIFIEAICDVVGYHKPTEDS
jgi:hypothetical protein